MKHALLLVSVFAVLLTSCSQRLFFPATHNVPMLREKNEARASAGFVNSDFSKGGEVQLAYSPVNHLGLAFNYAAVKGKTVNQINSYTGKGQQFEGACGYYLPMGEEFCFEVYGGVSSGQEIIHEHVPNDKTTFTKYYIQPSIGFLTDYVDVIFTPSIGSLKNNTQYEPDNRRFTVLEPAITLRGGFRWLKLQAQLNYSLPVDPYVETSKENVVFSFGISTSFAPRWKEGNNHKFSKRNW